MRWQDEQLTKHVVEDGGGRYRRLTCKTCNAFILRHPFYASQPECWEQKEKQFLQEHDHDRIEAQ